MTNLKFKLSQIDGQHNIVSFHVNDQRMANAVLIYPISFTETGHITTELLGTIEAINLQTKGELLDSIEDDFILSIKHMLSERIASDEYLFSDLIKSFMLKKQSYSSKRAYGVDSRRIAAACAIIYAQHYGIGLINSFNYFIKKLEQKPIEKRVITKYIARIRKEFITLEKKDHLVDLLGSNFPVEFLLKETRFKRVKHIRKNI